jgi:hypothetical protein
VLPVKEGSHKGAFPPISSVLKQVNYPAICGIVFAPPLAGLNPFETKVELDVSPKDKALRAECDNDPVESLWVI